jgi:PAS domain-containing protein
MPQKEIEVILMRQLASYLAIPIFLVDPQGTLIFYNEPAEAILGRRFEETGEMPVSEWALMFEPADEAGEPLPPDRLPLVEALSERRPAHGSFWIRGLDSVPHHIEVFAFPLLAQAGRFLGAAALFWEGRG